MSVAQWVGAAAPNQRRVLLQGSGVSLDQHAMKRSEEAVKQLPGVDHTSIGAKLLAQMGFGAVQGSQVGTP